MPSGRAPHRQRGVFPVVHEHAEKHNSGSSQDCGTLERSGERAQWVRRAYAALNELDAGGPVDVRRGPPVSQPRSSREAAAHVRGAILGFEAEPDDMTDKQAFEQLLVKSGYHGEAAGMVSMDLDLLSLAKGGTPVPLSRLL